MNLTTDENNLAPPVLNLGFFETPENTSVYPRPVRTGENESMNQFSFLQETTSNENSLSGIEMNNTNIHDLNNTGISNLNNRYGGKYRKQNVNKRKTRQISRLKRKRKILRR